jgi:hypothetical protein
MKSENQREANGRDRANSSLRKPYNVPLLRVYGSIATITRTIGMTGTVSDGGGSFSMSKTS